MSAINVVKRLFETVVAKDREAHDALFSSDCVLYQPENHPISRLLGVSEWRGVDNVTKAIALLKEILRPTGFDLQHFLSDGEERVACLYSLECKDSNGGTYKMPMSEIFRVVEGKVVEIRPFYWDTVALWNIAESVDL